MEEDRVPTRNCQASLNINIFPVYAVCENICHVWKDLQSSVQYMFVFGVSEHFSDVRKYLSSGGKHFTSVWKHPLIVSYICWL